MKRRKEATMMIFVTVAVGVAAALMLLGPIALAAWTLTGNAQMPTSLAISGAGAVLAVLLAYSIRSRQGGL